jgi:SAM-dependent methyltransferase
MPSPKSTPPEAHAVQESAPNAEQLAYWNGEAGERWARQDELMAALLAPIAGALLDHADPAGCRRALDVGCGGGSQSLMLAERLGPDARVTGVDISGPLLGVARTRAAAAPADAAALDFLQADAAHHAFEPGGFDLLFSRFGVMFFDQPAAAFANLHRAMAPGGRLAFVCWQSLQDNPWTWLSVQAALRFVPPPEPTDPEAPGPFAFANPARIETVLMAAGFSDIDIEHHPVTMRWSAGDTLEDKVAGMMQVGPVSRLLMDADEPTRRQVHAAVVEVMREFHDGEALNLPGATWLVTGSA